MHRAPGAFAVDTAETRYFDGTGRVDLYIGELADEPTAVAVAEGGDTDGADGTGGSYTSWATSDYYCWPQNAIAVGEPYKYLQVDPLNGAKTIWYQYPRGVKVTGLFGFSTSAPDEIKMATEIQTVRLFKRAQQAFEDAGAILELSQMRYVKKLDPDVENIINMPKFAIAEGIL